MFSSHFSNHFGQYGGGIRFDRKPNLFGSGLILVCILCASCVFKYTVYTHKMHTIYTQEPYLIGRKHKENPWIRDFCPLHSAWIFLS